MEILNKNLPVTSDNFHKIIMGYLSIRRGFGRRYDDVVNMGYIYHIWKDPEHKNLFGWIGIIPLNAELAKVNIRANEEQGEEAIKLMQQLGFDILQITTDKENSSKFDYENQIINYPLPDEYQDPMNKILRACVDWVTRPGLPTISLEDFLGGRFGRDNGYLIVTKNTFYRKYLPEAIRLKLIIKNKDGEYKLAFKDRNDAYKTIDKMFG